MVSVGKLKTIRRDGIIYWGLKTIATLVNYTGAHFIERTFKIIKGYSEIPVT